MTVGLPITVSFQDTNVTDPSRTIEELIYGCTAPIFTNEMEVRGDDSWVYEYTSDVDYQVRVWNQTDADNGEYNIDDVIMKDCMLVKVTGKSGTGVTTHRKPKEPEEYSGWDIDNGPLAPSTWSHRYFRVKNATRCGWLERMWSSPSGKRQYYMYWECRDSTDGVWVWNGRDLSVASGICNSGVYLRSYLGKGHSTKYDAAKDIKATIPEWASSQGDNVKEPTVQFHSVIERNGYFYFRTHLNAPLEYHTWETGTDFSYTYSEVKSPSDIKGFRKKRMVNGLAPFDGKNYTHTDWVTEDGFAEWTVVATQPFDSIALGKIVCDHLDIQVVDGNGNVLESITNYKIDNRISPTSEREYPSTIVLYTGRNEDGSVRLIDSESIIKLRLYGSRVFLGEIWASETLDAGFTKTSFKNTFKDFSPKEQDQWGNWEYIDGVRVAVHTGTVEFPIVSYDELNRLMLLIGGRKVVVNSSDSIKNQAPDGRNVFESTMMLARFTSFSLDSAEKNKRIGELGKYNFSIEELVSLAFTVGVTSMFSSFLNLGGVF